MFRDNQLKMLLNRCNQLVEFGIGRTNITDESVSTIIETLSQTLVEFQPNYKMTLQKLLEIGSRIPNL